MTSPHREWRIGAHLFRFEAPDLLRIEYHGALGLEEARRAVELYRELSAAGPVDVLGDMRDAPPLEPEVQRFLGENICHEWFRDSVYFGARLVHKALIKGAVLAAHLNNQSQEKRAEQVTLTLETIHYTATREEAELLLAALRARDAEKKA